MVGIIILNYITWEDTTKCIESIANGNRNSKIKYHIYVVDNNSPNEPNSEILKFLARQNITLIKSKENRGYSAGNNIGISKALVDGCESIIICNSDIVFHENSIDLLCKSLVENKEAGIVGPNILVNGQHQYSSRFIMTGLKEKYYATTFLRFLKPQINIELYGLDKKITEKAYVHDVQGCCFIISRKCIEEVGLFDENTFLYEEELILGIKMNKKGYKTLYDPTISITHAHRGSTKQVKAFSFICGVKSEFYYCKNYLQSNSLQVLPLYFIRTISYLKNCIFDSNYRRNILKYIRETGEDFYSTFIK